MLPNMFLLPLVFLTTASALSIPLFETYNPDPVDLSYILAAPCTGQSCVAADTAGSTGNLPVMKPVGAEKLGLACGKKYSPKTINAAMKAPLFPHVQHGFNAVAGWFNAEVNDFERIHDLNSLKDHGVFQGQCKKNILLFARGTSELDFAGLGKVGRALAKRLPKQDWSRSNSRLVVHD